MKPMLHHCADARSFRVLWMLEELELDERRLPQVAEDYARWYRARLRGLAALLERRDYVAGDRFTAADVAFWL